MLRLAASLARHLHASAEASVASRRLGYLDIIPAMAKVLVSLDDRLLARLDRVAADRGLSRSALLAELAARGLGESRGPGTQPEVRAALSDLDQLFAEAEGPAEDSTATIRAERDAR